MDTRNKIITTAMKLFVTQGFEHTPTSQISCKAEVATGTLFHHFKTKEDLINEAYLFVKKKMIAAIVVPENLSVKEKLKRSWNATFVFAKEHKTEIEFMMLFSGSQHITKEAQKIGQEIFEPFTAIIRQGTYEDLFKDLPLDILVNTFYTMAKTVMSYKKVNNEIIAQSFDMVWDALKK